jgi:hypothetical protein
MIREGPDYQAVLPDHGAPMLPDTEDVAGVRDDPRVYNVIKELEQCYCHINIGTFVLVHERGWGIIVEGDRHKGWTVEFMDSDSIKMEVVSCYAEEPYLSISVNHYM